MAKAYRLFEAACNLIGSDRISSSCFGRGFARRAGDCSRGLRSRLSLLAAFREDGHGVAAIEFALVVPVMLTMCLVLAEVGNAIENHRKVALFARAVVDLSGRASVPSMDPIFSAARAVLLPFDASTVQVKVSAIGVNGIGSIFIGKVCSSVASNTTARAVNSLAGTNGLPPVPQGFQYAGAHYVVAEVTMPYRPVIGGTIVTALFGSGGLTFSVTMPWADRTDSEVVLPGGAKCS